MITTSTGAKKIEDSDNWRLIFGAHNDSVDAHDDAIANIATVISGTTNNSGHAISAGEYFIANGAKYKASATIDTGATWSDKSTSVSDHDLINALNSKITDIGNITTGTLQTVTTAATQYALATMGSITLNKGKYLVCFQGDTLEQFAMYCLMKGSSSIIQTYAMCFTIPMEITSDNTVLHMALQTNAAEAKTFNYNIYRCFFSAVKLA